MNERIKYLRVHETKQLFDVVNQDVSRHSIRNKAIFYLTKYCALRVSEVSMITISDYNSWFGEIYCRREKGSLNNTIKIIDRDVKNILEDYYRQRISMDTDSKYLFISQRGTPISRKTLDWLIKKMCSQTSIPSDKWHFHVLRHTRAVELADAGLDIKEVQWWLGHKNIANTMIYMQFTTRQQDLLYKKLLVDMNQEYEKEIV